MKNIVNHKWLKDNLDKNSLVILDVREEIEEASGQSLYNKGHIKGAQYVSFNDVMVKEASKHGGRSPLPDLETFTQDMRAFGIDDNSIVVIYDDGNITRAGRLWWMLKLIGKDKVFVLDGGYDKWIDINGEITREIPAVEKSASLSLNTNKEIIVDMEYVKDAIGSNTAAIVDARAYERYTGEVEPIDRLPGHIPSALNFPWANLIKDGELLSLNEAREYFKELEDYEEIIVYCGSGITASVSILLLDEMGLNPKHYAGGYSDWISYKGNESVSE
ncbi:MAG: sulfurtransferase [Tissierellaceae bacterium]